MNQEARLLADYIDTRLPREKVERVLAIDIDFVQILENLVPELEQGALQPKEAD